MKLIGLLERRRISFAFLSKDMQQDRFFLRFQKLERSNKQGNIVSVDRPIATQPKLLEDDARHDQALDALLDFTPKFRHGFSGNTFHKVARFLTQPSTRRPAA